jgi:hypothetical protein
MILRRPGMARAEKHEISQSQTLSAPGSESSESKISRAERQMERFLLEPAEERDIPEDSTNPESDPESGALPGIFWDQSTQRSAQRMEVNISGSFIQLHPLRLKRAMPLPACFQEFVRQKN